MGEITNNSGYQKGTEVADKVDRILTQKCRGININYSIGKYLKNHNYSTPRQKYLKNNNYTTGKNILKITIIVFFYHTA